MQSPSQYINPKIFPKESGATISQILSKDVWARKQEEFNRASLNLISQNPLIVA